MLHLETFLGSDLQKTDRLTVMVRGDEETPEKPGFGYFPTAA